MEKMKKSFVRLIVHCLIVTMMIEILGSVSFAANGQKTFQMYVISETQDSPFVGDFLYAGGEVYVEAWTMQDMADIHLIYVLDHPTCDFSLERLGYSYDVPRTDTIEIEDSVYFPLEKLSDELGLFISVDVDNRLVMVQQCADLTQLEDLTYEIFDEPLYNIGYWKNSFWYDAGYDYAVTVDILKNMKFVSYLSGDAKKEAYQEAVWKTILPSSEDEMLDFAKETNKTLKTINKYKKYADNWTQVLFKEDSGFMGDWGEVFSAFGKAGDYIQADEVLNAIGYAHELKNVDESYMNGIKVLLGENKKQKNETWYGAMKYVYSAYENQDDVWELVAKEAAEGAVDDILNAVGDKAIKALFDKRFIAAIKATSFTLDLVLDTQNQVDATIKAHTCLELQGVCASYKRKNLPAVSAYWKNIDQNRLDRAKDFRDVLALYLRYGVTAYKAFALDKDKDLSATSAYSISRINDMLTRVMAYSENDFTFAKQNQKAVAKLASYADGLTDEQCLMEVETEAPGTGVPSGGDLEINWNTQPGGPSLSVVMSGMYGDEAFDVYSGWGGNVVASDGTVLVECYELDGYDYYYIHPGCSINTIEITADTPDAMIANNAIGEMQPTVSFTGPDGVKTTTGEYSTYLVRFPTGIWGMVVNMDMDGNFWSN